MMTEHYPPPDLPGKKVGKPSGYPSKGARLGPAWAYMWGRLSRDWQDGPSLAAQAAERFDVSPSTLMALLYRFRSAGILDKEMRPLGDAYTDQRLRGPRVRNAFRVNPEWKPGQGA